MNFLENILNVGNYNTVTGLTYELNVILMVNEFKKQDKNVIVLTNTLYEANKAFEALRTYIDDVFLFPMDDFLTSQVIAQSPEFQIKRLETIEQTSKTKKSIVVTNLMGYLKYLPDKKVTKALECTIKKDAEINREAFQEILEKFGYTRETICTTTGEYSIRGFVIDLFITSEEHPIRIELFGNKIEAIRYYDETTQASITEIEEIEILPFKEIKTSAHSSLFEYLATPEVIYIDFSQIKAANLKLQEDIVEYKEKYGDKEQEYMYELSDIAPKQELFLQTYEDTVVKGTTLVSFNSGEIKNFNSDLEDLKKFVEYQIKNKKTVVICLSKEQQINKIRELFDDIHMAKTGISNGKINVINKKINRGFIINDYVIISEYDIEDIKHKEIKYKNTYKIGRKIKGFSDLQIGDYVVHVHHGIGQYNGVNTLEKNGIKKDYLQINYAGTDKVYIPVEKIDTIYKYASKDSEKPKLNKLGTTAWEKTKRAVRNKISDISGMLLSLYAKRNSEKGPTFITFPEEVLFGQEFEYILTPDQEKSILDIDECLKSSIPMDRLLCGDVGFGKTEVAFRAMFKTVLNGYQVLYLCPTTILSSQQYKNAVERFKNYPINIALLNRYTSLKETKRILEELEKGTIDMVFGTHRLLSSDIKLQNLGLLIVDEEQRFGVTHKEKIKKMKTNVNVLTLSATPIPRTMKMAMSGLRDLSIIDTAPAERYPVQTYVIAENDLLIKDAIYKELSRQGQVFILYNRVEDIESVAAKINRLVPEARILTAHGQMSKNELEDVMQKFIDFEADILVCTTIIETGIDIQNANTLIIYNADHFGLSQLYQIRGRVGRSTKIAYAYLLYRPDKMLNEAAMKRLQSIKEFTELGSGYKIAMRDLSIRGAGDLLGSEQAGFVSSVGIDLYTKMIEEEIMKQQGLDVLEEDDIKSSLIDVETHISDDYVSDEEIKIEIHKKINEVNSHETFLEIKAELEDRFGQVPDNLIIYMYEEWFEKLAGKLGITSIVQGPRSVEIELPEAISNQIKGDKLFLQTFNINPKFNLRYQRNKIYISLLISGLEKHFMFYLVPLLNVVLENIK